MHKQLILLHNAIAAYFSGNAKSLEATLKQFNIKVERIIIYYYLSIELNRILLFTCVLVEVTKYGNRIMAGAWIIINNIDWRQKQQKAMILCVVSA